MGNDDGVLLKQRSRLENIEGFKDRYGKLTPIDKDILSKPISLLNQNVLEGSLNRASIWASYTKAAIECHARTNCITEFISLNESTTKVGPLSGVPVSLKDNFGIASYDATIGYPSRCHKPVKEDSALVKLLKDAGAILFVKTNLPTGMMSMLSSNAVWGTTANPVNPQFSPGGSSSGEGALIGGGGSRVGVGTDIGGSVRIPAHACGIYALRMSQHRFPRAWLDDSSTPGFEGIPDVASPLARTMEDLRYFIEAVQSMKPWEYSYQSLPMPWKPKSELPNFGIKKVGYIRNDGFLKVSPAVDRALNTALDAIRQEGNIEVEEFILPQNGKVYDEAYAALMLADGFETVSKPLSRGEKSDPVIDGVFKYAHLPKWLRYVVAWIVRVVFKNDTLADELSMMGPRTTTWYYEQVVRREELRREFWEAWRKSGIDVLLTPPLPTPALPVHQYVPDSTCNYTAIFNLLDYPAGVIPVTTVNRKLDALPDKFDHYECEWPANFYFKHYNADEMHGLPVGVQIVGMRLQDKLVLDAMELIDNLIKKYQNKTQR